MAKDEFAEQGIDDILASIRKIIAVEDGEAPAMSAPAAARPATADRALLPAAPRVSVPAAAAAAPSLDRTAAPLRERPPVLRPAERPAPRIEPAPFSGQPGNAPMPQPAPARAAAPDPQSRETSRPPWSGRGEAATAPHAGQWPGGVQMPIPPDGPSSPFDVPHQQPEPRPEMSPARLPAANAPNWDAQGAALSHPNPEIRAMAGRLAESLEAVESGEADAERMETLRDIWSAEQRLEARLPVPSGRAERALSPRFAEPEQPPRMAEAVRPPRFAEPDHQPAVLRPQSPAAQLPRAVATIPPVPVVASPRGDLVPAPHAVATAISLEDSVKAMLRPMLREWLNENMPRLLADAMRDEFGGPNR